MESVGITIYEQSSELIEFEWLKYENILVFVQQILNFKTLIDVFFTYSNMKAVDFKDCSFVAVSFSELNYSVILELKENATT